MDKVEKAVIDLGGEWPDERQKGFLVWNTDGYEGDKCGYSAHYMFTPGFPRGQELVCTYEEFMDAASRSSPMNSEHSGSTEGEGVKWFDSDYPPLGAECEAFIDSQSFDAANWKVGRYHGRCYLPDSEKGGLFKDERGAWFAVPGPIHFRPLQSHRDKCIEAALEEWRKDVGQTLEQCFGCLYDAGLLRLPSDKEGE